METKIERNDETYLVMSELVSDIIAERERRGWSQSKLAEMAGIKQSQLSRMEQLKALPQLDTLIKVLKPLNLKLSLINTEGEKEKINMVYLGEGVALLEVNTTYCKLDLDVSDDENFHFITDNQEDFSIEESDGKVVIKQKKKNVLRQIFDWTSKVMTIMVPSTFNGDIKIKNRNGGVVLSEVTASDVSVKNYNGRIEIDNVTAKAIDVANHNGRVKFQYVKAETIDVNTDNGRIYLTECETQGKVALKSVNGKIIMLNCDQKEAECESVNGILEFDSSDAETIALKAFNGRINASLTGYQKEYSFDTVSELGTTYIGEKKHSGKYVFKDSAATKQITAKTTTGDIRIIFADSNEEVKEEYKEEVKEEYVFEEFESEDK